MNKNLIFAANTVIMFLMNNVWVLNYNFQNCSTVIQLYSVQSFVNLCNTCTITVTCNNLTNHWSALAKPWWTMGVLKGRSSWISLLMKCKHSLPNVKTLVERATLWHRTLFVCYATGCLKIRVTFVQVAITSKKINTKLKKLGCFENVQDEEMTDKN